MNFYDIPVIGPDLKHYHAEQIERSLAIPLRESDLQRIEKLIRPGVLAFWEEYKPQDEHWIHNSDESLSYCYDCAKKIVEDSDPEKEWSIGGGWGIEGDSLPSCEECGQILTNVCTDYCISEEFNHWYNYGFSLESTSDCYSLDECLLNGWYFLDPDYGKPDDYGNRYSHHVCPKRVNRVGQAILHNWKLGSIFEHLDTEHE